MNPSRPKLPVWGALLFFAASLLSACSGSLPTAGSGIETRPISAIVAQPLVVTNFTDSGSASLPVHTSIPVACSVVYGKTPEFGALSLDQDMAGGAHSDHNPVLTGLEPDTTYYFRVQGVDESGLIYLSDVMTFTTPPLAESTTNNLASPRLGAEVTGFSSAFGSSGLDGQWGAANAFDDDPNTEWSSAADGNDAWIEVRLAKPARITLIIFHSRTMFDGTAATIAFSIVTDSGETYGPYTIPDSSSPVEIPVDIQAQTLRFVLEDTTGGNTGVVDIAVIGEFIE
ncbi:MAG: discoidin domain-containing protein [Chloroflexi bacterium]|nr:discoidin domain-containing protein [Chloroflexota bacterium]